MGTAASTREKNQQTVKNVLQMNKGIGAFQKKQTAIWPKTTNGTEGSSNAQAETSAISDPPKTRPDVELDDSSVAWTKVFTWNAFTDVFHRKRNPRKTFYKPKDETEADLEEPSPSVQPKIKSIYDVPDVYYHAVLNIGPTHMCMYCNRFQNVEKVFCRVCGRVYHLNCLHERGHGVDDNEAAAIKMANTDIGWSCPQCENIVSLLDANHMKSVMKKFDKIDIDQSATIPIAEYMSYYRKKYKQEFKRPLPADVEKGYQDQFNDMDTDKDGCITWWEFIIPETLRLLKSYPQVELIRFLKPREIYRIRKIFKKYDLYGAGIICEQDAGNVFTTWLESMGLQDEDIDAHPLAKSGSEHGALHGIVSWESFIKENAIMLIAARPNTLKRKTYLHYAV